MDDLFSQNVAKVDQAHFIKLEGDFYSMKRTYDSMLLNDKQNNNNAFHEHDGNIHPVGEDQSFISKEE